MSLARHALILLLTACLFAADAAPGCAIELSGVPFVRQEPGYCGPAALAAVMAYYQAPDNQRAIARQVYTPQLRGSLITDLERYATGKGFTARAAQGTPADLKEFIRQGRPVIVLVDLGFWVYSRPHYLVVTGYDEPGFTAHTGTQAGQHFSTAEFQRIWQRKGCTYLLIWR